MNSAGLTAIFKKQPIGFSGAVLGLVLAGLLYVRSDQIAENQAIADAKAAEAAQMLSNTRHAEGLTKQVDQMQAFGKEVENRLVRSGQLGINLQYFYCDNPSVKYNFKTVFEKENYTLTPSILKQFYHIYVSNKLVQLVKID